VKIPKRLRMTYRAWLDGHDLRDMLSKSAYYRHRSDLKEHGINIDLRPESTECLRHNQQPFPISLLSEN